MCDGARKNAVASSFTLDKPRSRTRRDTVAAFVSLVLLWLLPAVSSYTQSAQPLQLRARVLGNALGALDSGVYIPTSVYAGSRYLDFILRFDTEAPELIEDLSLTLEYPTVWQFLGLGGVDGDVFAKAQKEQQPGLLRFIITSVPQVALRFSFLVLKDVVEPKVLRAVAAYRVVEEEFETEPVEITLVPDTAPPSLTVLGPSLVQIECRGVYRDYGAVASDAVDGDITARIQVISSPVFTTLESGTYQLTYTVTDLSGNTTTIPGRTVFVGSCPPVDSCANNCANDSGKDDDGDGLTNCREICLFHTSPVLVDTDADGMPDPFEIRFFPTLNPNFAGDRDEDPDFDGLSNLAEFLQNSSPVDGNSPAPTRYVAPPPQGSDETGDGSLQAPWATLNYALTQMASSSAQPRRLVVFPGNYVEDITLLPNVSVVGIAVNAEIPRIVGHVVGGEGSRLEQVTLTGAKSSLPLLDLQGTAGAGVAMRVVGVYFLGGDVGVIASGTAVAKAIFENCTFEGLHVGFEVRGSTPKIRRCFFRNLLASEDPAVGVRFVGTTPKAVEDAPALGDINNPNVGWNQFDVTTIEGYTIANERSDAVKVQLCDWKTNDVEAITDSISGPAVVEPFLKAGSAVLASAVFCTVTKAGTEERITNGSVQLIVSTFGTVSQNENGVYGFPAVGPGNYSLIVNAPGFSQSSRGVGVLPGQQVAVVVPLGEAPPAPRQGCFRNQNTQKSGQEASAETGTLYVIGAGLLLWARNRFRRVRG
jgi:hypothetical protein